MYGGSGLGVVLEPTGGAFSKVILPIYSLFILQLAGQPKIIPLDLNLTSFPLYFTETSSGFHGRGSVSVKVIPMISPISFSLIIVSNIDPFSKPDSEHNLGFDTPFVPIKFTQIGALVPASSPS
jgi:hypothetical protein